MARLFEIGSRDFSTTPFGPLIWAPQQRFGGDILLSLVFSRCFPVKFIMKWVWVNTYRYNLLVGWTSIYQLFWGSVGTRVLTHPLIAKQPERERVVISHRPLDVSCWLWRLTTKLHSEGSLVVQLSDIPTVWLLRFSWRTRSLLTTKKYSKHDSTFM